MAGSATNSQPPQISTNASNKEVIANGNLNAASPAMYGGQDATTTNGLTWGYIGGWYAGALVPKGTLTLTASTTNYVYFNNTTGAFSVSTTAPGAGNTLCYTIVTGTATITSWSDNRVITFGAGSGTVTSVGATGGVETDQTGGAAITTSGNVREAMYLAGGAVATAAYTWLTGDRAKTLVMNSATAVTQPLPAPTGTSGGFPSGWFGRVENIGAGTTTLTMPGTLVQLDGVANGTLALPQNTGVTFFTDGTNFFTVRGAASGGGSSSFAGLSDVSVTSPADGQVAVYKSATGKWTNTTPGTMSVTSFTLASMTDSTHYSPSGGYTVGGEIVVQNQGVLTRGVDYTASDGVTIVFTNAVKSADALILINMATLASGAPFDIISFYPGAPTASAKVTQAITPQKVTLPINLTGSYAIAGTAATASTTFAINKISGGVTTAIGSINFAASAATGTFTFSAAVTTALGDIIQVVAPASPDATLADISFAIVGTR